MLLMDLNGIWEMRRVDKNAWYDAEVPGSVYSDLLRQGRMEDPFYRENADEAFHISCHDYEYKRTFFADESMLSHDRILLRCEGLDTLCDIFVNGVKVLEASDMHRTYTQSVKDVLKTGENEIIASFQSPVRYVTEQQKQLPLINSDDAVEGISHLRKAHYMFGWDWSPKLPDMGIWRNISLVAFDTASIHDIVITQNHTQNNVALSVAIEIDNFFQKNIKAKVSIESPTGKNFEKATEISGNSGSVCAEIKNPHLWWPNNLGDHPLYRVKVSIFDGDYMLDSRSVRIGLRTLSVRRQKDGFGESFEFQINGRSMFSMGADYVPEDNILQRLSKNRTERLIQSCVQANFNTLRVWGGAFYPDDYFYDLCDEYGLIVWQDFMFACGVYHMDNQFKDNIVAETVDNVKRIRHHACLGLWCGNNELEWAWDSWGWSEQCSPRLKAEYIKMFEVLLPETAQKTDRQTSYWYASPSSGRCFEDPNSENSGDMHFWEVWGGGKPFSSYRSIVPRFISEFGIQSFPAMDTVKSFTLPEDRNPYSPVMEFHQKCCVGNEAIMHYIAQNYRFPKDFESFIYLSQLVQANGLQYGVEHWRRNRGRCMGTIYWQLNDCWPVVSWSSIDYFGRWKALHYAAKRFFTPVLVSAEKKDASVDLYLSNESTAKILGMLRWKLMDTKGHVIRTGESSESIQASRSRKCVSLDFSNETDTTEKRRSVYLAFRYETEEKTIGQGTLLFVEPKQFSFCPPCLNVAVKEYSDRFTFEISAASFAKAVELKIEGIDAVFSDNYFDLPQGENKMVELLKKELSPEWTVETLRHRLFCRSLYDSYSMEE